MQTAARSRSISGDDRSLLRETSKGARRVGPPFGITVRAPGRKTGRDGSGGLEGLLIDARGGCACHETLRTTGRKIPLPEVCSLMSQRKDRKPAAT